ncbi:MAG TPA: nucleotide sugar dehydrogenase [Ktedonosporobacter sp.]|jgi:UDP-N-acetyl-D-mannosaminuronic acid dehydrogenase|nr:nucleotide sugar dehydrogenase [Ktedonosporobacter sp.]
MSLEATELSKPPFVEKADVCVIGMGYVGLTLAVSLAQEGLRVIGYEVKPEVCDGLNRGQPHFFEKGISEALGQNLGSSLAFVMELPSTLPRTVVICVGTPLHEGTKEPDLRQIEAASAAIAERLTPDTLVILRSTVPVGTSRNVVLPLLCQRISEPLLAFCPERTIQGKALEELRSLPQIIGGLNEVSAQRAKALFEKIAPHIIMVSSLEAAEMVKLICNAHTDLIYGYGNEVALMAETLGLDAYELINAANLDYPRPDLSKPGFVGGGCLSKDPYLLIHSAQSRGHYPSMVAAARCLNESLPIWVGERVLAALQELGSDIAHAKILITGFAYKGQPETDDMRGSPATPVLNFYRNRVQTVVGHDFIVPAAQIARLGIEPVDLALGFEGADAVLVLNNHVQYQCQDIQALLARMKRPGILFDAWGVFQDQLRYHSESSLKYLRLGYA